MIDDLQKAFGSLIKSLEVFYVINNLKPASRIIVDEDEMGPINSFLQRYNLTSEVSGFKIIKEIEKDKKFSNSGIKIQIDDKRKGQFFLYISKDKELAKKAKAHEEEEDHLELGKILGYPDCCCDFFLKNHPKESRRYNDYILAGLRNSKGKRFQFYNNFALRCFDIALISHFPCRLECEKSLEIAKKNLAAVQEDNMLIASILENNLKGAVIYTETEGVFLLKDAKLIDDKIFFNSIMPSVKNNLFKTLKKLCFFVPQKPLVSVEIKAPLDASSYDIIFFY